jgi:hypothetical protein
LKSCQPSEKLLNKLSKKSAVKLSDKKLNLLLSFPVEGKVNPNLPDNKADQQPSFLATGQISR